jgi:hypothetical protein
MKKLPIAISLTISLLSLPSAAQNIVFKPMNDDLATKACYAAASKGIDAARSLVKQEQLNFGLFKSSVSCNGYSFTEFVDKYSNAKDTNSENSSSTGSVSTVTFRANNDNAASQVCVDALLMGEQKARDKHELTNYSITCNDEQIDRFVRKYKNKNIIVRNDAL